MRKLWSGAEDNLLADCGISFALNPFDCFEHVSAFWNPLAGIAFRYAPLQRTAVGVGCDCAYLLDDTNSNEGIMGK